MMLLVLAVGMTAAFLIASAVLWSRAGVRPPMEIRTMSGRSPEEHAFRRRVHAYRDGSLACLVASIFNMLLFAAIGLVELQLR